MDSLRKQNGPCLELDGDIYVLLFASAKGDVPYRTSSSHFRVTVIRSSTRHATTASANTVTGLMMASFITPEERASGRTAPMHIATRT